MLQPTLDVDSPPMLDYKVPRECYEIVATEP